MNVFLKMKIKALASEAKIIRHEERKWPGLSDTRRKLHQHRVIDVRQETRVSLLAYGFLRGREYLALEHKCHEKPPIGRTINIAKRFANPTNRNLEQDIQDWFAVGDKEIDTSVSV